MSLVNQYRSVESQIKELQSQLELMKSDSGFQKEMEFKTKLKSMMAEYGKSLRDVIAIVDPNYSAPSAKASVGAPKATRAARVTKIYKNPHTGEVIETKGGNHKLLKSWKEQYGSDEVVSWLAN